MATTDPNIDSLLSEVGAFGRYQTITVILICIPSLLSATYNVNYMFIANTLDYRCKIPECDIGQNNREILYNQSWLLSAIPLSADGKIENCVRFTPIAQNRLNSSIDQQSNQCSESLFDKSQTVGCSEFVYTSDERNLQTEFNIHCMDTYKLAFVGTAGNFGRFIALPLVGLLCDRFGRLKVTILMLVGTSVFGLIKSFSTSYLMYFVLEFFESLGTNAFAGIFVLVLESIHSDYRILCSVLVGLAYPIGEILLGICAAYVHDFRQLLRILYAPGLLTLVYLWLYSESIRWLLVTGRTDRAIKVLKQAAAVNKRELSPSSIEYIQKNYSSKSENTNGDNAGKLTIIQSLRYMLKSKLLLLRFISCCYIWITCCLCYYGLSLSATNIPSENRYRSFIFMTSIEIPGILLAVLLLKKMRRRHMMFTLLFVTAIFILVATVIPANRSELVLLAFLVSKASITCAIDSLYVFTAECWPTNIRTTVLNSCSMIGRIGAIIVPSIAILGIHYASLPGIVLGCAAMIGAFAVRFCPETYDKEIPDTMQEANNL